MTNKTLDSRSFSNRGKPKQVAALLLVDVISDFDFEDGVELYRNALKAAKALSKLKNKAVEAGIPVIYVNDNYGNWQDDFKAQFEHIVRSSERGRDIAELLEPGTRDYYILKPQRSGFYETPLDVLLRALNVSSVMVTGFATDICVLFTAHDAYMRGYAVSVPADCCAAVKKAFHKDALSLLERVAKADITASTSIDLSSIKDKKGARP